MTSASRVPAPTGAGNAAASTTLGSDVGAVLSTASRPASVALAGTPISSREDHIVQPRYIEFVIRVYADGRRERHAHLFVEGPDGAPRLERRPQGRAAAWAEQVIRDEWIPLRRTPRRPRS
jgi:hypothetical protein